MEDVTFKRKPVLRALVVASFLLLVSNAGYYLVAEHVTEFADQQPLDASLLESLPVRLGEWTGEGVHIEERIIQATGADVHVIRRYVHRNSIDSLNLYVAAGTRARAFVEHRPDICYIASGWTLTEKQQLTLSLNNGGILPCTLFKFSRGGLSPQSQLVLVFFVVDGQFYGDVAPIRSKVWRNPKAVSYVSQVQIVTPLGVSNRVNMPLITGFARDASVAIAEILEGRLEEGHGQEN